MGNLIFHKASKRKVIEQICKVCPNCWARILSKTFIIKSVNLNKHHWDLRVGCWISMTWVICLLSWFPRKINTREGYRTCQPYKSLMKSFQIKFHLSYLHCNKQSHALYTIVSSINIVTHKQIVCVGDVPTNPVINIHNTIVSTYLLSINASWLTWKAREDHRIVHVHLHTQLLDMVHLAH